MAEVSDYPLRFRRPTFPKTESPHCQWILYTKLIFWTIENPSSFNKIMKIKLLTKIRVFNMKWATTSEDIRTIASIEDSNQPAPPRSLVKFQIYSILSNYINITRCNTVADNFMAA